MKQRVRQHVYRTALTWRGAEGGPTASYATYSREYRVDFDGKPSLQGSADPAFRGDPALYNPEDLLVASLSSCHLLTYLALCSLAGIEVMSYSDDAVGTMEEQGGVGRFTRVVLRPRVTIASGNPERALALHEQAHHDCFIAASVNFPVDAEPVITVASAEMARPEA